MERVEVMLQEARRLLKQGKQDQALELMITAQLLAVRGEQGMNHREHKEHREGNPNV